MHVFLDAIGHGFLNAPQRMFVVRQLPWRAAHGGQRGDLNSGFGGEDDSAVIKFFPGITFPAKSVTELKEMP